MRLATFNLHHGAPPGRLLAHNRRAVQACSSLDADVLALQEVEVRSLRAWLADQPGRIAGATGAVAWFVANWAHPLWGRFGNALVVRGALVDRRVVELAASGAGRRRRALIARVELDSGEQLTVASTHLDERRGRGAVPPAAPQLGSLLDAIAAERQPRALLGDFNMPQELLRPLVEAGGFDLVTTPATYPALAPTVAIDGVATSGLTVMGAEVPDVRVSDHRPVVVSAVPRGV